MLKKIPSILKRSSIKPQNVFSSEVIEKATKEVCQWFQKEFNYHGYEARVVASGMVERAKKQQIADILRCGESSILDFFVKTTALYPSPR